MGGRDKRRDEPNGGSLKTRLRKEGREASQQGIDLRMGCKMLTSARGGFQRLTYPPTGLLRPAFAAYAEKRRTKTTKPRIRGKALLNLSAPSLISTSSGSNRSRVFRNIA